MKRQLIPLILVLCLLFSCFSCQKTKYPESIMCMTPLDSTTSTWTCYDEEIIRDFVDMMRNCSYTEITQEEYDRIRETDEDKKEHVWTHLLYFGNEQEAYSITNTGKYLFSYHQKDLTDKDSTVRKVYKMEGFDLAVFDRMMAART